MKQLQPEMFYFMHMIAPTSTGLLLMLLKQNFASVKHAKPPASRKGSPELYVIAQGFKGRGDTAPEHDEGE